MLGLRNSESTAHQTYVFNYQGHFFRPNLEIRVASKNYETFILHSGKSKKFVGNFSDFCFSNVLKILNSGFQNFKCFLAVFTWVEASCI